MAVLRKWAPFSPMTSLSPRRNRCRPARNLQIEDFFSFNFANFGVINY